VTKAIELFEPTPLVRAAMYFKQLTWIDGGQRKTLLEIPGPALSCDLHTVVGEASILGWLDRRYPYPEMFPASLEHYARASTLAHALTTQLTTAKMLWTAMQYRPHSFLTGPSPNIADLALVVALQHDELHLNEQQTAYIKRVFDFAADMEARHTTITGIAKSLLAGNELDIDELW
jgi:glutathione S-transferase